jgi:hypothetical protein
VGSFSLSHTDVREITETPAAAAAVNEISFYGGTFVTQFLVSDALNESPE